MSNIQQQIEKLRNKIESYRALQEDLGETAKQKIAELQNELRALIQTQGGAFIAGDVQTDGGDFVGRDKIINNVYQGAYHGLAPHTEEEALCIYKELIMDRCGVLPLQGVTDQTSDATTSQARLSLPGVYIQLQTNFAVSPEKVNKYINEGNLPSLEALSGDKKRGEAEIGRELRASHNLSVLQAAILVRRLVLLGEPGSGKTTFVNFLAHCIAAGNWGELNNWREDERDILPVLVVLRDFAYWLSSAPPQDTLGAHALWTYILHDLKLRNLEFAAPLLERAIQKGRALILLDGLDEVPPSPEARGKVLRIVDDFSRRYRDSRYLVTCRVLSYDDPQWQLNAHEFPSVTIAPFNETQISDFIHAWHTEIASKWNKPRRELEVLESKLRGEVARREDLRRLAPNPLLLTVMALVHTSDGELPEARARLYERAVDILLWRWDQQKGAAQGEESRVVVKLREAGRDRGDLLVRLSNLAFRAHGQLKDGDDKDEVTGISEADLLKELRELHPKRSLDWAEEVVEIMKMRAGLLLERTGGVFSFPHRTFQEYLAGMYLARQNNFTTEALKCVTQGDFWRIVVLLAVGSLVHSSRPDYEKPLWLAEELCPINKKDDETAWRRAWLAGEVLLEMGLNRVRDTEHGRALLGRVCARLTDLLEAGVLTPRQRLEAGDALAALGDPRFDEKLWSLPVLLHNKPEPLLGFVHIPGGAFVMGSADDDKDAYKDERPQHKVNLPDFYLARYPQTNAQYAHFMEAGGYETEHYWTPQGWDWRQGKDFDLSLIKDDDLRKNYQDWLSQRPQEKRGQPFFWNHPQWGAPTRPVVGVSWYESLAYCAWLEEQLQTFSLKRLAQGGLSAQETAFWDGLAKGTLRVGLPSEAHWEKSARAAPFPLPPGEGVSTYPWGSEITPDHANYDQTGLKQTSPVGMFPRGASALGLLDLSGNVWEWTHTPWRLDLYDPTFKYPYLSDEREAEDAPDLRVLRGGSWSDSGGFARCAYRAGYIPGLFGSDFGFRMMVSPGYSANGS